MILPELPSPASPKVGFSLSRRQGGAPQTRRRGLNVRLASERPALEAAGNASVAAPASSVQASEEAAVTPFLLCHGLADGVVLPEMSGLSVASLLGPTAGPIDSVKHCTYPGLQHAFCASEVGDIGDFLLKRLPRKEAAQLSAKSEGSEGVGNLPANQQAARAKTVVRGNAAVARPQPLCGQREK